MSVLVTGGAGFIGSNFVRGWLAIEDEPLINLDKLTYAGSRSNIADVSGDDRHMFVEGDIGDFDLVLGLLRKHGVRAVVNLAAESHVDRSIHGPEDFIQTNVVGTFRLLEASRAHWGALPTSLQKDFRFLHVSTDEVYGSLSEGEPAFTESHRYAPNSPYSASKAASDHLVRAYHKTYGLPTLTTSCSNNFGPFQLPEKLIPLCIERALAGKPLPLYGDGLQRRDWLYVDDHCSALRRVLDEGVTGEVYNIGGGNELSNMEVVQAICSLLDELNSRIDGRSYAGQIAHVADRPGHDRRYAVDVSKIMNTLDWRPGETFASGLRKTVEWYLAHPDWVAKAARRRDLLDSRQRSYS
jgi:dTDP-glucose 4,6-dehydratase